MALDPLKDAELLEIFKNVFESDEVVRKIDTLGKKETIQYVNLIEKNEYIPQHLIKNSDLKKLGHQAYIEDYTISSGKPTTLRRGDTLKLVIGNRHFDTTVIGVGSFGCILQSKINNAVYKLLKLETELDDSDTRIYTTNAFQNICKEVAIQNIISSIKYKGEDNQLHLCASPVLRMYRMNNKMGKTAELAVTTHMKSDGKKKRFRTKMLLLEMNVLTEVEKAVEYEEDDDDENDEIDDVGADADADEPPETFLYSFDNFVSIFHDFLRILYAIEQKGIQFGHCDIKLNNVMKDQAGNLRLIDFGFSSIHFKQQTGFSFMLISPHDECGWIKSKQFYYPEKDVLQFLLASILFELDPKAENFRTFLLNLGYAYDPEPYHTVIDRLVTKHSVSEFNLGYNYDLKLRTKFTKKLGNTLHSFSPRWLLEHFDTILKSFADFNMNVNKNKRTIMPIVKGGSFQTRGSLTTPVNEWGTTPKKSMRQKMKNYFTRKRTVVNQPPKKSFTQKFKNMITRKKVHPMPTVTENLSAKIQELNKKYTANNMNYNMNYKTTTEASNPQIINEIQERYLINHPRTGFTAPLARKTRKHRK